MLKALQESENDPADPGKDELFSHYYTLACMLQVLNGDGGIFNDKMVDWIHNFNLKLFFILNN